MYECNLCNSDFNLKTDILRHFETSKHLSFFNEEQQFLIKNVVKYIQEKTTNGNEGIRINSAGGTGKTYTISSIFKDFNNVVCLAPTNKAVQVLQLENFKAKTFHNFFGWEQDIDENDKEYSVWKPPKIIDKNTIFILDEISMMGEEIYSLFRHFIYDKYKFILMGDKCQLAPIRNKQDGEPCLPDKVKLLENKKDLSLFFQFECNEIKLFKNMRARNEELNKKIHLMRNQVINNKQITLFNNLKFTDEIIEKYKTRDYKIICYKNDDVEKYNNKCRKILNPNVQINEAMLYDKIYLTKFYNAKIKEYDYKKFLQNGYTGTITSLKETFFEFDKHIGEKEPEFIQLPCYEITVDDTYILTTIKKEYRNELTKWKNNLVKKIKKYTKNEKETDYQFKERKIGLFKKIRRVCNEHCYWIHNFASTVYKAQGSSYDVVFVLNSNCVYFNNRAKYTACSRARDELFVF